MRRFWSSYLAIATLGGLLAFGISPAGAYYPPVEATATKGPNSITISVVNPKTNITHTNAYLISATDLKQQNGVMAWAYSSGSSYFVDCATYDPVKGPEASGAFITDTQGPFAEVSQLTVQDGVVAYVAGTQPSDMGPGYQVFGYATYDPVKGAWQKGTFTPSQEGMSGFTVYDWNVTTKDGIVFMKYKTDLTLGGSKFISTNIYADLYAAWSGNWSGKWLSEVASSIFVWAEQEPAVLKGWSIDNATISVTWVLNELDETTQSKKLGYDWWKEENGWSPGPTKPAAYYAAQPTHGPSTLWVWFTDMSLGGASVDWWFGDGATSTKRSDYHKYTKNGFYTSQQKITGTGTSLYSKGIYVGTQPPWFAAYSSLASAEDLTLLRRYRDEVLSKDPQGKVYKEQLYDNSAAALNVMLDNLELLAQARNLIQANMGAVIQVLQGHEGTIDDLNEVLGFLKQFKEEAENAPPQLRALINVVQKEIRQSEREGKPFLGFRFGPPPPKQQGRGQK